MPSLLEKDVVVVKSSRRQRVWGKKRLSTNSLVRKGKRIQGRVKKPRRTKIDLWREWLVPDNAYHRYEGLRGVYWYWLSRDVRKSEWEKYGVCLTCLEPIEDWHEADCGHILASAGCGEYLRLNRINLTIQHKGCNNPQFSPMAGVYNAININKRHGAGYMENLIALKEKECKQPTQEQYRELIRALSSYQEALSGPPGWG